MVPGTTARFLCLISKVEACHPQGDIAVSIVGEPLEQLFRKLQRFGEYIIVKERVEQHLVRYQHYTANHICSGAEPSVELLVVRRGNNATLSGEPGASSSKAENEAYLEVR